MDVTVRETTSLIKSRGVSITSQGFDSSISVAIFLNSVKALSKSLGFSHALAYVVGVLFGSGMFISPGLVAKQTNSMGMTLLVWIVSGTICVFGSLCFCELASALKKTGGEYIFIKEAYGDVAGFCLIWAQTFVIFPTGLAVMGITIGDYCVSPFYDSSSLSGVWLVKSVGIFSILVSLLMNCVSTSFVGKTQIVFSVIQVIALLFFLSIGIWKLSTGDTQNYSKLFESNKPFDAASLSLAFYNSLWAYDGWGLICTITEEMHNPERDLWLAIVIGIPLVIIFYVLINLSFMTVLTHEEIGSSITVATKFIEVSLGKNIALVVPILSLLFVFSSTNAILCITSRSLLSAAREGDLPQPLSFIHRNRCTPIPALCFQVALSFIWILAAGGEAQSLVTYFSFAIWLTYGAAIFAVIVLRIRQPNLPRPIKVWIINPIFMTLVSLYLIIGPFAKQPIESSICLVCLLTAIPAFFMFVRGHNCFPSHLNDFKNRCYEKLRSSMNLVPCVYNEDPKI